MIVLLIASFMSMFYDQMSDIDRISETIISQLEEQMEPKGFYLKARGGACKEGKISQVSVSFKVYEILDIHSAREDVVMLIDSLLQLINSNPKNQEYFHVFPVTVNEVSVGLSGNIKLGPCDFVSSVFNIEDQLLYFQQDPYNYIIADGPFLQETYEEAKHQLSLQKDKRGKLRRCRWGRKPQA